MFILQSYVAEYKRKRVKTKTTLFVYVSPT